MFIQTILISPFGICFFGWAVDSFARFGQQRDSASPDLELRTVASGSGIATDGTWSGDFDMITSDYPIQGRIQLKPSRARHVSIFFFLGVLKLHSSQL